MSHGLVTVLESLKNVLRTTDENQESSSFTQTWPPIASEPLPALQPSTPSIRTRTCLMAPHQPTKGLPSFLWKWERHSAGLFGNRTPDQESQNKKIRCCLFPKIRGMYETLRNLSAALTRATRRWRARPFPSPLLASRFPGG